MALSIRTLDGANTQVSISDIDALRAQMRGGLLAEGAAGYDQARTIWNAMIDRRPALIAQCLDDDDVSAAVRFAATHRLLVAIRGGGHNIAGNAVCDGGLMLDLSPMNSVQVNQTAKTAVVGAGATLGAVDAETQKFGLATSLGINSTTGVAGLTLGGGFGWLSRSLGLTIDNLLSARVVLASGERVRASATENPDLFWAIRGGGGNFGVVTSFEFKLHPVGPEVLAGLVVHPLDAAREVLQFYREFLKTTPDEFVCWFVMRQAPPLPFLAPEWHGKDILALAMCYAGSLADGERIAAPLRKFGQPLADVVAPHPFVGWQQLLDPMLTPGARNYWKSNDFLELSDGLIDTFIAKAKAIPDPQCEIAFAQLGGAISRVPADATSYGHRDAQFTLNVHGRWADAAKDNECIAWARSLYQATAQFATGGVYINFLTQEEGDRIRSAYGKNFDRVVALKARYDPMNLFRMNQNIQPVAAGV